MSKARKKLSTALLHHLLDHAISLPDALACISSFHAADAVPGILEAGRWAKLNCRIEEWPESRRVQRGSLARASWWACFRTGLGVESARYLEAHEELLHRRTRDIISRVDVRRLHCEQWSWWIIPAQDVLGLPYRTGDLEEGSIQAPHSTPLEPRLSLHSQTHPSPLDGGKIMSLQRQHRPPPLLTRLQVWSSRD